MYWTTTFLTCKQKNTCDYIKPPSSLYWNDRFIYDVLKLETRKCKIIVSFTTRIVSKFRRAIVPSCLFFYTADYWSLGTVVYLFKVTFSPLFAKFCLRELLAQFFSHLAPLRRHVSVCLCIFCSLPGQNARGTKCFPQNLTIARQWVAIVA